MRLGTDSFLELENLIFSRMSFASILKRRKKRNMTNKSFFFWGMYEGNEGDEVWKTLHEHFEKLASENDDGDEEAVVTHRKARK
jgi:hypothetical protein